MALPAVRLEEHPAPVRAVPALDRDRDRDRDLGLARDHGQDHAQGHGLGRVRGTDRRPPIRPTPDIIMTTTTPGGFIITDIRHRPVSLSFRDDVWLTGKCDRGEAAMPCLL